MIILGNGAEKTRLSERRDDGKAALPVKAGNSELLRLPADFAAALPPRPRPLPKNRIRANPSPAGVDI